MRRCATQPGTEVDCNDLAYIGVTQGVCPEHLGIVVKVAKG